jgi:hypothetical protein
MNSLPNFLVHRRLDFRKAAVVAQSAAEASVQKCLDQFQGERSLNHFPTQSKDVLIVILDALMCGEHIMDEPARPPGTLCAAMDAPTPLPQSANPRSTSRAATALAKG